MAQAPDYFSDMLAPGEDLLATLGGAGPAIEKKRGSPEQVWFQLAITHHRLLVVKLVMSPLTGSYAPVARLAADKSTLRFRRFPRTPASPARLEIVGAGDPIQVVDIDDEKIFPYVEPFLAAWGGPVDGAGAVVARARDPYTEGPPVEGIKVLYTVLALVVLGWLCCGCSGFIYTVKTLMIAGLGV